MGLDGLIGPTIGGLSSHFLFEILKGRPNFITLHLFFIKFILQLQRHTIVPVLGLLELDSSLVDLGEDVEVFVLVHGGLSGFVQEDVVALPMGYR